MTVLQRLQQWIGRKLVQFNTRSRVIHGVRVEVFNLRTDIDESRLFARMEAALGLLAVHDPRRLRRLIHDVDVFHVRRGTTRGVHYRGRRLCALDNTFVANPVFTDAEIAACIVHEAMHARISTMRVVQLAENNSREERICRRAEIAFAERLPNGLGAPVLERAGATLAAPDGEDTFPIDWREVDRRVLEADLKVSGLPGWLKRRQARARGFAWHPDGTVTCEAPAASIREQQ